jgi:hypothetical protein
MNNTNKHNGYDIITLIKEGLPLYYISKLVYGDPAPENIMPTKDLFIFMFQKKNSFKYIADTLKVPEKTVKQWCKIHNLPGNLKDMKKYIKENI